jgi:flagellar L-ring protein FlgH
MTTPRHPVLPLVVSMAQACRQGMLRQMGAALALVMLWLGLSLGLGLAGTSHAESLFYARAAHLASPQPVPHSLFTAPLARNVGDSVTIRVDERSEQQMQVNINNQNQRTVDETGSRVINGAVGVLVDKLPFGGAFKTTTTDLLRLPSLDGVANKQQQQNQGVVNRVGRVRDSITCQVIQVLPNGHLVVQGRKVNTMAKERTDLMVSGIVNPFYLSRMNEIDSQNVANLQFMVGGQGMMSNQQREGLMGKFSQLLN